jgi:hypothetical protein
MGSFATTCTVSGLPIEAGDAVRYLLLTENPYKNEGNCLPYSLWVPRVLPIKARYNDYGSIERYETGEAQRAWADLFRIDLCPVGQGDNPFHDLPTSKDMPFEAMLNAVWENRVRVFKNTSTNTLSVQQAMIREDVWQALLERTIPDWNRPKRITAKSYRKIARQVWGKLTSREEARDVSESDFAVEGFTRNPVPAVLGTGTHFLAVASRYRLGQMPENEVQPFLDTAGEFHFINRVLGAIRYQWKPTYPNGPQFGEWRLHQKVLTSFAEIARKASRRYA